MAFPLELALRYLRSRRRAFISVSTVFAILGVALGTAALVAVMSVTGGFRAQFRCAMACGATSRFWMRLKPPMPRVT